MKIKRNEITHIDDDNTILEVLNPNKKHILNARKKDSINTLNVIMISNNGQIFIISVGLMKSGLSFRYKNDIYHVPTTAYYKYNHTNYAFYIYKNPNPINFNYIDKENKNKIVFDVETTKSINTSSAIKDLLKGEKGDSIEFIKKIVVIILIVIILIGIKIYNINIGGFFG